MKPAFRVGVTPDFVSEGGGVLSPALAEVFDPVPGVEYEVMPDTGGVGDPAVLDRYDGVISYAYAFPASSFQGVRRLAVIALWGAGFDRVDVRASSEAGVIVALARDSVARPAAEGIIALIFALAKKLRELDRRCRSGEWRRNAPTLADIAGSTLGSIGCGGIAREMFRMAGGLGFARLLAYSPRSSAREAEEAGVRLADLETVMRESDFVAVNCPLTAETRGMIGARELGWMQRSAYLINTARGAVVDEAALTAALRRDAIAGAALDVFETEPPAPDNPLLALDNVIATPHLVVRTGGCIRNTSLAACRNVLAVARGGLPRYLADPGVVSHPRVRGRGPAQEDPAL